MVEVAGKMPGLKYGSLAQGVGRFWRRSAEQGKWKEFAGRIRGKCK